jgi:hypothetical protein
VGATHNPRGYVAMEGRGGTNWRYTDESEMKP